MPADSCAAAAAIVAAPLSSAAAVPAWRRHFGTAAFWALVVAYVAVGLVGHDPWKQDETYIFGIVHSMLTSGDLVVPTLAGEPFVEKPPLYYWVAAAFGRWSPFGLPVHDAARLASGLFMALTLSSLGLAARCWYGREAGRAAVLLALSSLGLLIPSHLMLTDVAQLSGFAVAILGLALISTGRDAVGGLVLGTGVGIGFLSKGLFCPGCIGVVALALPVFPRWRRRGYLQALALALVAALPWLTVWPALLYQRSPALFDEWFWQNNLGRYLGYSVARLGAAHPPYYWTITVPWFFFPLLPLALVALWRQRRQLLADAGLQVCLPLVAVLAVLLGSAASARDYYALPAIVPLALLAVPAVRREGKAVRLALSAAAVVLLLPLIGFVWYVFALDQRQGNVPDIAFLHRFLPAVFHLEVGGAGLAAAAAALLLLVAVFAFGGRERQAGLNRWVASLAVFWVALATLWLPWIDAAKTYRGVFADLSAHLPAQRSCLASAGLAESERAMLHTFLGIITERREEGAGAGCDLILAESLNGRLPALLGGERWETVWTGGRPGDERERFALMRRR